MSIDAQEAIGHVGRIPVRNLWVLMLYASELRADEYTRTAIDDNPDGLADLVAEILTKSVRRRLRRQLRTGYIDEEAALPRVRGRIDHLGTHRRMLMQRGLVSCRYATLSIDTPRNRFVRAALEAIARVVRGTAIRHDCRSLAVAMRTLGVSGNPPTQRQLSTEQFTRNDVEDRYMVAAARLAMDLTIPAEQAGSGASPTPDRDEYWVRRLFEKAVYGVYDVHLRPKGWAVRHSTPLAWPVTQQSDGMARLLPSMETDITLDCPEMERHIVIDTKFTSITTVSRFSDQILKSGHLYQLYTYLRTQTDQADPATRNSTGILLHPTVGASVDEYMKVHGHTMRFVTVDLAGRPKKFRDELLEIVLKSP